MKKIQMVDLLGQYDKIQKEIDSKILEVVKSAAYINGPEVHSFQKELENYLNVKHVIRFYICSNCGSYSLITLNTCISRC